jgi:hypothetical protein
MRVGIGKAMGRIVMHCTCSSTRIACSNCLLALGLLVRVLDSFGYKYFTSFVESSFMAWSIWEPCNSCRLFIFGPLVMTFLSYSLSKKWPFTSNLLFVVKFQECFIPLTNGNHVIVLCFLCWALLKAPIILPSHLAHLWSYAKVLVRSST